MGALFLNVIEMLRSLMGRIPSILLAILIALLLVAALVGGLFLFAWLLTTEPIGGLPKASESATFLGALLGAQSAIAALTLAVSLFLMQGVSARRDVDDRVYAEYIRRSQVWPVFFGSIGAVAITGLVLTAEMLIGDYGTIAQKAPGTPNLALLAVFALFVSLASPVLIFERAIRLAKPEHWRKMRQDVNKRDVREAVRAFFGRKVRVSVAQESGELDRGMFVPDAEEGSANQAIRALLDDARRAMDERRQEEFERSLNAVKELVKYAMDEIERAGVPWRPPGSEAMWPPLWELGRNLYPFRMEVIRADNREYIDELLMLDYWLVSTGLRRSCGELFTAGLDGYRSNYQISTRVGSREFQGMIRDRFLMNLDGLTFGHDPERLFPFMQEVVRHQGRVLSYALHSNNADDFRWLQQEFSSILSNILQRWNTGVRIPTQESEWPAPLTQEYRIALMGLAGRAVILEDSGELADANPYLDVARSMHVRTVDLSSDIASALQNVHYFSRFYQWENWEVPEHISGWSGSMSPDRYPLTCFAVLLMELADNATSALDLRGHASHILNSFVANSERLERLIQDTPAFSAQQRRERATEILQESIRRDEIAEEYEIARSEISKDRVDEFTSSIYSGALTANSVDRLFEAAGAVSRLIGSGDDVPGERGFHRLEPKVFFNDTEESGLTYYGKDVGRSLSRSTVDLLCEALESATQMAAFLDSMDTLLGAIDVAIDALAPVAGIAVVLAGDWEEIEIALLGKKVKEYLPYWQLEGVEIDPSVELGRYRGYPILRGPRNGERQLYVFEPGAWGTFVRAPFADGQYIRVDVDPISPERAQELLQANPNYFSDQPDDESKKRKMQTFVEVTIGVCRGFEVIDPTRARKIAHGEPLTEPNV